MQSNWIADKHLFMCLTYIQSYAESQTYALLHVTQIN